VRGITLGKKFISSIFVLAPWGYNFEATRIVDALECGAIPITLKTPMLKKLPAVPWIVTDTWEQARQQMEKIVHEGPEQLNNLQKQTKIWWRKYTNCAKKHIEAILNLSYSQS